MDPDLVMYQTIKEHKVVSSITEHGHSEVRRFYNGATVFVTGGTGFLGKQLIEKLFRASTVFKVYLLIRGKKGKTIQERLEDMLKDPVFDVVREKQPHFAEKIIPLEGDVSCLRLGLSQDDWNTLIKQLEVIFHVAATTKFDEGLRVATQVNVKGTREALALGKECKILKSFVHVSTAFVNATDESAGHRILEQFYPCPMPPEVMIQIAETVDDQLMSNIEANLIKGYPNTYTFTKSLAEELVRGCEGVLPICVVRPAIVIASYKEPIPGWVDMSCAYGASGLILGPATGLVHVLYGDANTRFGLVPVDYVNNAILVAGFDIAHRKDKDVKIYTISGARNLSLWGLQNYTKKFTNHNSLFPTLRLIHGYSMIQTATVYTKVLPKSIKQFSILIRHISIKRTI